MAGSSYLDARTGYEGAMERGRSPGTAGRVRGTSADTGRNPFGDHAEAVSLRDVSPRPASDEPRHTKGQLSTDSAKSGDGPTETRQSLFRERL
jgi:hypothetical protein